MVGRLGFGETWILVTPYLRARMRPSGLEVQGMQEGEPVEGCGWVLSEDALCNLVVVALEHAGASLQACEQLRDQMLRLLRGEKGVPK